LRFPSIITAARDLKSHEFRNAGRSLDRGTKQSRQRRINQSCRIVSKLKVDGTPNFRKRKTRTQTKSNKDFSSSVLHSVPLPKKKVQKGGTATATKRHHLPSSHTAANPTLLLFNTPCPLPLLASSPHGHSPVVPLYNSKSGESLITLPTTPIRYVYHGRLAEQSDPKEPGVRAPCEPMDSLFSIRYIFIL
jgi:hypothetical protein